MSKLLVCLFGTVRIEFEGQNSALKLTRAVQNLLAFLLLHRQRMLAREMVASVLWSEQNQESARNCLNTALWRLRRCMEASDTPDENYLLISHLSEIGFNMNYNYWLDVEDFENAIDFIHSKPIQEITESQIVHLEKVLLLYRGDLLEGSYEDWALREREFKRQQYINACQYLMSFHHYRNHYDQSLSFGQKILQFDPLREDVHRTLIRIYLDKGERPLALRQYEICRSTLIEELGVPPMEETQNLYQKTLNAGTVNSSLPVQTVELDLQRVLAQLQQLTYNLAETHRELRLTLQSTKNDLADHTG
jgi:DNA-binding SARP family transcriptional activator